MKKLITLFSMVLVLVFMANAQDGLIHFPFTSSAPTIDGDASDWPEAGWVDIGVEKPGGTTHDMTAKFQVSNDGENIYLIVDVKDATPHNEAAITNTYERDCSEVFFSMHTPSGDVPEAYVADAGDWQIRFQRADENDAFIDGSSNVAAAAADFGYAVSDDGASEYFQEMSFPIATLQESGDFDGVNFRFNIQIADNTTGAAGGRTQQMFYFEGSDNQWNDLSTFAPAILDAVGVKDNANVTASAYAYGSKLYVNNVNGMVSIYDVTGKLVQNENVVNKATIDIADLKAGLYIVKNNDFSTKVIKR